MIDEQQSARIRRLFFAEHWKIGTIAAELSIHHDTVRRAIASDTFNRETSGACRVPATLLDPYKVFIGETLAQHPRLRSTRLFEMIKGRGYPGSAVQLRRYVACVRPTARTEAYFRLRTLPGEQAQVDWGHFGRIKIGHADRALSCFVMVLGWSRAMYARFFLDQTTESFLYGHVLAFEAFGGVPRGILYDNLKSAVIERVGDHIRYGDSLLEICGHYHFAPHPCAPARGNEKGKVERAIQYLRHAFFEARRFSSIGDLNRQLAEWIISIAHERPVPGDPEKRRVKDALDEERPRLLPMPEHRLACDVVRGVSSGKTPYIRFDLNDYSIPHYLVGKPLTLLASENEVRIANEANGGRVFARHTRSYDRGQIIEDAAHLAALADEKRHARGLRGRDRLRASCKHADAFLEALALKNEPLGTATRRLLVLLDEYGARAVDHAIKDALERGAISADSVAHVIDQQQRKQKRPPRITLTARGEQRFADLRVVPHDLADYDGLAKPNQNKESK
jgi:transposase